MPKLETEISYSNTGSGECGIQSNGTSNLNEFKTDEAKTLTDKQDVSQDEGSFNSSGGDAVGSAGMDAKLEAAERSSEVSITSEEYYDEDSDLDFSVHSEFIPISTNAYGGLPLRSKSTSDLVEEFSSYAGVSKEYNAQFLQLSQLRNQNCREVYYCHRILDDDDTYSIQSDILPSPASCSFYRQNTLTRSKSTSELDKYSNYYISPNLETESEFSQAETYGSCSWYSDSEYDYDWDLEMYGRYPFSSSMSMSMSNIQPYLSRECSNPDEFLISIYSNPNLQRSFSLGDIQCEFKSPM